MLEQPSNDKESILRRVVIKRQLGRVDTERQIGRGLRQLGQQETAMWAGLVAKDAGQHRLLGPDHFCPELLLQEANEVASCSVVRNAEFDGVDLFCKQRSPLSTGRPRQAMSFSPTGVRAMGGSGRWKCPGVQAMRNWELGTLASLVFGVGLGAPLCCESCLRPSP